jgi:hypothetical protein
MIDARHPFFIIPPMSCIPDIKTTDMMHSLYLEGYSISQVAAAFSVTRQSVFTRFKRAGKAMREKKKLPFIIFNERKYTVRTNGYYACCDGRRAYLHRDVWRHHYGNIPVGYDVHHLDEDKHNNRIENLALLTKSEHTKLHRFKNNQYTKPKCNA